MVAGTADEGADPAELADALGADVVLIDIAMRHIDGLSAIRQIRRRCPGVRTLVLTMQDGEPYVRAALQAGADGYLLKETSRAELLIALDSVSNGKRYISPSVSAPVLARYLDHGRPDPGPGSAFDSLTAREKQVLKLIAEGRRNREIAKYLFISVKTVEKHRSNLMHKTNLHNTAALTSLAVAKGLVGNPAATQEGAQPPGRLDGDGA